MCYTCWKAEGSPEKITAKVLKAARLIGEADEFGALHIVVDDWNLDDDDIKYCMDAETITADERSLAELMLSMDNAERFTAMAIAGGFINGAKPTHP